VPGPALGQASAIGAARASQMNRPSKPTLGAGLRIELRSVNLVRLSNVSGANEIGEPTPTDVGPRQATTSHGFRS
jgi:hypothetical protein